MILIGIGANIPSAFGPPRATCGAALAALMRAGVEIVACSSWWRTAPVPASDQPWFINAVVAVASPLPPADLLAVLLRVETAFGRVRGVPNADRVLDLDLLDHHGMTGEVAEQGIVLTLPHPRMHERAFVLLPLLEIDPGWRHPVTGLSAEALAGNLPPAQAVFRMPPAAGLFGTEWEQHESLPAIGTG